MPSAQNGLAATAPPLKDICGGTCRAYEEELAWTHPEACGPGRSRTAGTCGGYRYIAHTDLLSGATLNRLEFIARYYQGDDYARWVCQFREANIVGRFSPDFSIVEALETLVWGVAEQETVVQRRWVASRM